MKIHLLLYALLVTNYSFQQLKTVHVYQYLNADSTNKKLVLKKQYNELNQLVLEEYSGYKKHYISGGKYDTLIYQYHKNLLGRKTLVLESGDSMLITYSYTKDNQVLSETTYHYQRHFKMNATPQGCSINPNNYEKEKRWKKYREIYYMYDNGNKISQMNYSFIQKDTLWTGFKFFYDKKNRLKRKIEFDKDGISREWTNKYKKNTCIVSEFKYYQNASAEKHSIETKTVDDFGREIIRKIQFLMVGEDSFSTTYSEHHTKGVTKKTHVNYSVFDSVPSQSKVTHLYSY